MESIQTAWNLFSFFSLLALPQLLGVLAYFRIKRFQRLLAHLVGFLIPPILYFGFSWLFFVYLPHKNHVEDNCGMAAAAAAFIVLLGTGAQTVVSLIAQLVLRSRYRTSV